MDPITLIFSAFLAVIVGTIAGAILLVVIDIAIMIVAFAIALLLLIVITTGPAVAILLGFNLLQSGSLYGVILIALGVGIYGLYIFLIINNDHKETN